MPFRHQHEITSNSIRPCGLEHGNDALSSRTDKFRPTLLEALVKSDSRDGMYAGEITITL